MSARHKNLSRHSAWLVAFVLVGCRLAFADTPSTEVWRSATAGVSLSMGKPVAFYPRPTYSLTTDENDLKDLTDGKLSGQKDDRIWFNKGSVGWLGGESGKKLLMVVDLGESQPVGTIALRALGGRAQGGLELPASVEFLASEDGKTFHILRRMEKLMPAERDLDDGRSAFYVAEDGKAFVHTFVCQEPVQCRYIGIRVIPVSSFFTDEIAVLRADRSVALRKLDDFPETGVFTSGVAVTPKLEHDEFVITSNVITPNWLLTHDAGDFSGKVGLRIETPPTVELVAASGLEYRISKPDAEGGRNVYTFPTLATGADGRAKSFQGPFYFRASGTASSTDTVTLTGLVDGKDSQFVSLPLRVVEIPTVPRLPGLAIDLGWIVDKQELEWPEGLNNLRKLGFGYVSTFPRYFERDGEAAKNDMLAFLAKARKEGFGVVLHESPFHIMIKKILDDVAAGKIEPAEKNDVLNQGGKQVSPLYRGRYFEQELDRVADMVKLVQPDRIYWDIECWWRSVDEAKASPAGQALCQKSGKSWDDFSTDTGAEALQLLDERARAALGSKSAVIGLYNAYPDHKPADHFFLWKKIYPAFVDIAMPSLYVQGRAGDVAKKIRASYEAMGNKNIIPWLSAGTYGEFAPALLEPMVLETILNGAGGFLYYRFEDFDPLDFYYHAKALSTLCQFAELIQVGKPVPFQGTNADLHYTAFASDKEGLVIVGNYQRSPRGGTSLPKLFEHASLENGQSLEETKDGFVINVPPGEFRLVHLRR